MQELQSDVAASGGRAVLQLFRGSLTEPEVPPSPGAQFPSWDTGQQRSHLELGTAGRLRPPLGHGRGSVLPGLPMEEWCPTSLHALHLGIRGYISGVQKYIFCLGRVVGFKP